MTSQELLEKLKRCNKNLYLGANAVDFFNRELGSTGIYLRNRHTKADKELARKVRSTTLKKGTITEEQLRKIEDADIYLGFITCKYVPEGSVFLPDRTHWAKGWRELLLHLIELKIVDLERARKVFRCPSLGISTWDKMSDEKKFLTHKYTISQQLDYQAR